MKRKEKRKEEYHKLPQAGPAGGIIAPENLPVGPTQEETVVLVTLTLCSLEYAWFWLLLVCFFCF